MEARLAAAPQQVMSRSNGSHGGQPAAGARQGPPTRRCHAIAPTTLRTGVARPLRGGSARPSHAAISSTARAATSSFRRGSCRARCASVHIPSSPPIPDDHAPPSETPRSGGNRRPIRTQTGCQRRLSQSADEASCNQEETGGLEQGLDDEPEPVVTERRALVLQEPGVAALDRPAPPAQPRPARPAALAQAGRRPPRPAPPPGGARVGPLVPANRPPL